VEPVIQILTRATNAFDSVGASVRNCQFDPDIGVETWTLAMEEVTRTWSFTCETDPVGFPGWTAKTTHTLTLSVPPRTFTRHPRAWLDDSAPASDEWELFEVTCLGEDYRTANLGEGDGEAGTYTYLVVTEYYDDTDTLYDTVTSTDISEAATLIVTMSLAAGPGLHWTWYPAVLGESVGPIFEATVPLDDAAGEVEVTVTDEQTQSCAGTQSSTGAVSYDYIGTVTGA
jgi:hypothetical protein